VLTPPGLYGGGFGAAGMQAGRGGGSTLEQRAASANVYNSPGWKRLQAHASAAPQPARGPVIDLAAVASFTLGDRVFHPKFGYGTVAGIDGDKLDVRFDKAGVKKIVARFVVAADQAGDVPF